MSSINYYKKSYRKRSADNSLINTMSSILGNHQLTHLHRIMRHTERLIMINNLLRENLPSNCAHHYNVIQVTPTELTIGASSSAWLSKLRYMQPQLLAKLKEYPQLIYLNKISLKVIPIENTQLQIKIPPEIRHLSKDNRILFNILADSISDPEVKKALIKLANHPR